MRRKLFVWMLLSCLAAVCPPFVSAQKGLKIQSVFQRYGKQKNVTMVELSREMLDVYGMKLYKSITIKGAPAAVDEVRRCLASDQQGAKKIKEMIEDGKLVSAFYQLPGNKDDGVNRFILFKVGKKDTVTLVYIEGELDSDDLVTLLFTKRDL